MFRQDYVLRLIEQFARTLAGLIARIRKRETLSVDIRAEIGVIARQSGLDLDVARSLDVASMMMWLAPTGEIDPARFWLMGELLFLDGAQSLEEGATRARGDLERAHAVFAKLPSDWRPQPDLPAAGERMAEIQQMIDDEAAR